MDNERPLSGPMDRSSPLRADAAVYARPAIPVLLSLATGIAVGVWWPALRQWFWIPTVVGVILMVHCIRGGQPMKIVPLLVFVGLGCESVQPWVSPNFRPDHIVNYIGGQVWQVTGTIDARPLRKSRGVTLKVQAERLACGDRSHVVRGRIRVTAPDGVGAYQAGDRISFSGRLRPIRNFNNPGGFDYRRYLAFEGVHASAYVSKGSLTVVGQAEAVGFNRLADRVRRDLNALIAGSATGDCQAILRALLVGDRSGIERSLRQRFNRVGAGHLLAISGLHVGIVATAALMTVTALLSRFRSLLLDARVRKAAAILAVPAVLFYGAIAGMSPATQRAVIMASIFLLTLLTGRHQDGLNTLVLAALFILVVHPPSLFSISMQLSFAAVAAILLGIRLTVIPIANAERSVSRKAVAATLGFLIVSVWAMLGTLPLVAYYFNQLSLAAIVANAVLVPMIGFVVVPVGVFSVFISLLSPTFASAGLVVCAHVTAIALQIIDGFGAFPHASIRTVTPSMLEMVCYYGIFGGLVHLFGHKANGRPERTTHRTAAIRVIVVALTVFSADVGYWVHRRYFSDDLRVTVLDVGQGNAVLLELPRGHTILIDGGGFSDNNAFDMGARVVGPYLWRKKIATVDTLILSHPDSDHLNGLIAIAENFCVREIWRNRDEARTEGFHALMRTVREKRIVMPRFDELERTVVINGVRFDILHPSANDHDRREKQRSTNDNSLVVRICFRGVSFLFPGDITASVERELVRHAADRLGSTILLSPHHGSRSSNSDVFIGAVRPDTVIVSSGWRGRHQLPHPRVVQRYARRDIDVIETKRSGAVRIRVDGNGYVLTPTIVPEKRHRAAEVCSLTRR